MLNRLFLIYKENNNYLTNVGVKKYPKKSININQKTILFVEGFIYKKFKNNRLKGESIDNFATVDDLNEFS